MALIKFPKREKKDTALTVRLKASTFSKLKELAKKNALSQSDVIEHLIETAHAEGKPRHKP